ncbi:hypothetical protein E2562_034006 [Oryza meyeriana var. granulata]|uniref:Uncharacterized protein n=1 Tax=Oryza meyeriana var. granulata TaxID=110450 RepID=A0A6G1ES80_9ORYZ|nr:hypothetical protein E2562_034006 [Oryza meyeriana var. granulata]
MGLARRGWLLVRHYQAVAQQRARRKCLPIGGLMLPSLGHFLKIGLTLFSFHEKARRKGLHQAAARRQVRQMGLQFVRSS